MSSETVATIYMPLGREGTDVWKPKQAVRCDNGFYRVLGPVPYNECWMFSSGAVVRCELKPFKAAAKAWLQSPLQREVTTAILVWAVLEGVLDATIGDCSCLVADEQSDAGGCGYHFSSDACTELIRQNPEDSAAYLHRGHAYLSKGEYGQAHADYIKAMELDGLYDDMLLFDTDKFSGYDRSTSKAWPTHKGHQN